MLRDLTHPVPVRPADRDLLSFEEGQVAAAVRLEPRWWHAASLAEPSTSHRRRHTSLDTGVLARDTTCDRLPEALSMLPPCHRRPTRRPHRRPPCSGRSPTPSPSHPHTSNQRCCDDRLNPPSTPRSRSAGAFATPSWSRRWARSATRWTTRSRRASSPPWSAICWTGTLGQPGLGSGRRCSTSSRSCHSQRRHSTLDYHPPATYERQHPSAAPAAYQRVHESGATPGLGILGR